MSELTRISISLENTLLDTFDKLIDGKGYATRSEAIRDLIRDRLVREEARKAGDGQQVAVLSLVYDCRGPELAAKLVEKQHNNQQLVMSSFQLFLSSHHCLKVAILRGPGDSVAHLADEFLAMKGVLHGEVIFTGGEGLLEKWT